MNGKEHGRAIDLITRRDVEGISDPDARWLEMHLQECEECAAFDRAMSGAAHAVRAVTVVASASLLNTTQRRLRARAAELQDQQNRLYLIGISFVLGLLWSAGSLFLGWKLSGWLAERLHAEAWAIATGMVLFWLLPAMAMALVLVFHLRPTVGADSALWLGVHSEGDGQ
jgi:hypothetical protein